MKNLFIMIFSILAFSHAVTFDTVAMKKGFVFDSAFTIQIFNDASDCSALNKPCQLKVMNSEGGAVFLPVRGLPFDTLAVSYNFPRESMPSSRLTVSFEFLDASGNVRGRAYSTMGFKDPSPPLGIVSERILKGRFVTSNKKFNLLGRVK